MLLMDPDSRSTLTVKPVPVGEAYNVQITVDTKDKLIAAQQVHSQVTDMGPLAQTAAAVRENLAVCEIDAVADRVYYKIEDIEACQVAGVTPYAAKPVRSQARNSGHIAKSEFE